MIRMLAFYPLARKASGRGSYRRFGFAEWRRVEAAAEVGALLDGRAGPRLPRPERLRRATGDGEERHRAARGADGGGDQHGGLKAGREDGRMQVRRSGQT